jgi:hypothetical protein
MVLRPIVAEQQGRKRYDQLEVLGIDSDHIHHIALLEGRCTAEAEVRCIDHTDYEVVHRIVVVVGIPGVLRTDLEVLEAAELPIAVAAEVKEEHRMVCCTADCTS